MDKKISTAENTVPARQPWETPVLEVIAIEVTASGGPTDPDGGFQFSVALS